MHSGTKVVAWIGSAILFLMFVAGMSAVLKLKEPSKIISGGANALAKLFEGVLK
jgi:hypothetical protein